MSPGGLTYTDTPPVAAAVEIHAATARDIWTAAFADPRLRLALVEGLADALDTTTHCAAVESAEGELPVRQFAAALALGKHSALRTLRAPWGGPVGLEIADAVTVCTQANDAGPTPTVAVRLSEDFRDRDARTRHRYLQVVVGLAHLVDVHLVASRIDQLWLADRHRDDLPGVSEAWSRGGETPGLDVGAALGTAEKGAISLVNYPIAPQSDRAEGRWHADGDCLVVSCEGDSPMTVWTTLALILADYRTFDRVLTEDHLEDHDVISMLADGTVVLRGMRTIGWLPNDVNDYADLVEAFRGAAEELGELTRRYHESDEETLRSAITRHALGLAGSLLQLCDLADVEVIRVVKFPEFSRRFTGERAQAIWRSLAIGSAYGHHLVYRQVFEDREEKREQALRPTVDAANPTARLNGSWVIVGDFGGRTEAVADDVKAAFAGLDSHEDAPEIRLRCTAHTRPTRRQVAETTRRMLGIKALEPTSETVSLLHGLAPTPFDVADALERLAGDNDGREVDVAEVRYALTTLDLGRLLRGYDGRCITPRRLLAALLDATTPRTRSELASMADVSRRSLSEYLEDLLTVGLVTEIDGRYELALSTTDADGGRYADRTPRWVCDMSVRPDVHAAARAVKIGRDHRGPGGPVETPGWPYEGPRSPPDLQGLSHPRPWLEDLAVALWGLPVRERYVGLAPAPRTVETGPTPAQQALGAQEVTK